MMERLERAHARAGERDASFAERNLSEAHALYQTIGEPVARLGTAMREFGESPAAAGPGALIGAAGKGLEFLGQGQQQAEPWEMGLDAAGSVVGAPPGTAKAVTVAAKSATWSPIFALLRRFKAGDEIVEGARTVGRVDGPASAVAVPGQDVTEWQARKISQAMGGDDELYDWAANINLARRDSPEEIQRGLQELMEHYGDADGMALWARRRDFRGDAAAAAGQGRGRGTGTSVVPQEETLAGAEKYVSEHLGQTPKETMMMRLSGEMLPEKLAAMDTYLHVADYDVAIARARVRNIGETKFGSPGEKAEALELAQNAWLDAVTRQAAVGQALSGNVAEVGRALNILKRTATARKKAMARAGLVEEYQKGKGALMDFAKEGWDVNDLMAAMDKLDNSAERAALGRYAVEDVSRGMGWKLMDLWKAGLLSGPATHMTNMTSNSLFTAMFHAFEQPLASGVGALRRTSRQLGITKGDPHEGVLMQEAIAQVYGLFKSVPMALRVGARSARHDMEWHHKMGAGLDSLGRQRPGTAAFDPDPIQRKLAAKHSKLDIANPRVAKHGAWARATGLPFTALGAEDSVFKNLAFSARLHGIYMREAIEKGVPFTERYAYVARKVRNPEGHHIGEAAERAHMLTFTDDMGKVGRAVQRLSHSHPLMGIPLTFVKTPARLFAQGVQRTPGAGWFSPTNIADMWAGGLRRDLAVGRMGAGLAIGGYFANEMLEGKITGPWPEDKAELARWRSEGKLPFSRLVEEEGGRQVWQSYARHEPLATPLAFLATGVQWYRAGILTKEEWDKWAGLSAAALAENFMSKSVLQGPYKTSKALGDPNRHMESYVESLAGSLIPSAMNAHAKAEDHYRRDATGLWDEMIKTSMTPNGAPPVWAGRIGIGDMRQLLPYRSDLAGRKMRNGDTGDGYATRLLTGQQSEYVPHKWPGSEWGVFDAMSLSNARIGFIDPFVRIRPEHYAGGADRRLIVDAQLLPGGLEIEMNPREREYAGSRADAAATKELGMYIPQMMNFAKTRDVVPFEELVAAGVPRELLAGELARMGIVDQIGSLIEGAYHKYRRMETDKIAAHWRDNGTLRAQLDAAGKRSRVTEAGRENMRESLRRPGGQ
jgi:hypothetical protein